MKRTLTTLLVAGLGLAGAAATAQAGPNANAKILLHSLNTTTKQQCTRAAALPSCPNVAYNNLALAPAYYFTYLLVSDGNQTAGIGGMQCGILYDGVDGSGVDIFTWTLCATLEFQSTGWPASGGGNLITWDTTTKCQRTVPVGNDPQNGVTAVAGYFYMGAYTPDLLRVTPRPVDGTAKVADCAATEDLIGGTGFPISQPSRLGIAAFGQSGGYNPCGVIVPVANATWSTIKGQYTN